MERVHLVVVRGAKIVKLLSLLVDFSARADVDEESDQDCNPGTISKTQWKREIDLPNGSVESENAPDLPLRSNPAP